MAFICDEKCKELNQANKNLAKAQKLAHIGSWEMDIINRKNYWSDETYRIFGINKGQYDDSYEGFLKFVHPDDLGVIQNVLSNPPMSQIYDMEFRIIRSDGSIRNIYELMEFTFDENRKPIYIHGTTQDITEKKEMEKLIEQKQKEIDIIQRKFQVLIQESSNVFEIIDSDGTILYISEAVEKVFNFKPKERIGKKIYDYYDEIETRKLSKMIEIVLEDSSKKVKGDIIYKTKTGKKTYIEVNMKNLLHEPSIKGIVIDFMDITRRVEMEKKMAYISTHDELTNLPNRTYFNRKLSIQCLHAKNTNTKFALIMLDVDGFKNINYSLGFERGNKLIKEIVLKLRSFLGETIFISRYSEDHFAIIVQGLRKQEEYESIVRKLIKLFSKPFIVDKLELDVTVNLGICIYPDEAKDADSLRKQTMNALIRAKKDGKNRFKFFSIGLDIQNYKEFIIRNDFRHAIERNELRIYYQPIINLKTNEILGAEVLARWEHPDWGIIKPEEFIPLAEDTGLIIEVGKWILREVCRNYNQWMIEGKSNIKVAVNYSSIQFYEKKFVENILKTIDEFDLNPNFLIMEITENIFLEKGDNVISNISKLQSYGIQIALDDFGTGYSSLAYLNSFNIDILKLDGSFIKNITTDEANTVITKHVITMAQELKIKLVAEKIENFQQLSYLKELNCFAGQGYIYSKPVPLGDFNEILSKEKCMPM
ncbi:sensor domain-containing protein [Sedimentibacter sp. MB31-C6]|uniref:sensor domain-containing protein n=1 Tax=Sedimentibacter sp. MB31-C6 TaxID=3109366 RepID=UPI002DDDA7D5|nr:EAL domain-containing protein [Sedimentibacter sp. MB36-C1]WSI03265.1 EAL domain-containing protein [Sedimentibacter sp. MB36-C1]